MRRATLLQSCLAAVSLTSGCAQEPVKAAQVVFTLRSDVSEELSTIQATVYDALGERAGDRWTFQLAERPLPFSLTVVPSLKTTTDFMLLIIGRDADGNEVIENKTNVRFVQRETISVELWLSRQCLGTVCGAAQTCVPSEGSAAECGSIPWREGKPTKPGEEFGGSVITEMRPTVTEDGSMTALGEDGSLMPSAGFDAGPGEATDGSVGTGDAAPRPR